MSDDIAKPLARYAAFKRRGDFIFMSGVIAVDPDSKRIVAGYEDLPDSARSALGETGEFSVDFKEGPIRAQSWYVLDRIRSMIEMNGGQMSDVFKLVQYFKDLRDFPDYSRVRGLFFPDEPPVSTVVEVSGMMPSAEILIEVEATAYLPEKS
ncbi:RidA family protein [Nitratireductor sp. XY-223]|uniref:RidA family protein n=1 Tax=Nitratireductor sp. XY-223 TaxID=2561926 RepID=UPI0010AA584D|nr:RidA family protein [Nitratireductor sp. XY-223]